MSLTGTLGIDVTYVPGGQAAVRFTPARPVAAGKLFAGLMPQEAAARMRMMFAICANAHAAAVELAAEAAEGRGASEETSEARAQLIAGEALREHAVRILSGWAALLGREPDVAGLRQVSDAWRTLKAAMPAGRAQAAKSLAEAAMGAVFASGGSIAGAMTARAADGENAGSLEQAGAEADGTVLGRQQGHPRLGGSRVMARLLEVEALSRFLSGKGESPLRLSAEKTGALSARAVADVARGRLTHDLTLQDGRIAAIRIDAPTSANFSEGGAAERAIAGLRINDRGQFEFLARLAVLEVDPCVAYDVRFS